MNRMLNLLSRSTPARSDIVLGEHVLNVLVLEAAERVTFARNRAMRALATRSLIRYAAARRRAINSHIA